MKKKQKPYIEICIKIDKRDLNIIYKNLVSLKKRLLKINDLRESKRYIIQGEDFEDITNSVLFLFDSFEEAIIK